MMIELIKPREITRNQDPHNSASTHCSPHETPAWSAWINSTCLSTEHIWEYGLQRCSDSQIHDWVSAGYRTWATLLQGGELAHQVCNSVPTYVFPPPKNLVFGAACEVFRNTGHVSSKAVEGHLSAHAIVVFDGVEFIDEIRHSSNLTPDHKASEVAKDASILIETAQLILGQFTLPYDMTKPYNIGPKTVPCQD